MRSVGFLRTFQHIQWLVCLANRCETLSKSQPNLYHFMGISWSHISFPPTSQFRAIQHLYSVYVNDVYIKYTVDLKLHMFLQLTNYTSTISIQSESTEKNPSINLSQWPYRSLQSYTSCWTTSPSTPAIWVIKGIWKTGFLGKCSRLHNFEWIIFMFLCSEMDEVKSDLLKDSEIWIQLGLLGKKAQFWCALPLWKWGKFLKTQPFLAKETLILQQPLWR